MTLKERELELESSDGEEHLLSLCSLQVGTHLFGIDTSRIREVLGHLQVERVPLAPPFIGGVVSYRGDVLTAVNARALFGLPGVSAAPCVLVLEGDEPEKEWFGLIVDSVGGVAIVDRRRQAANPSTLDDVGKALFSGAFRVEEGLLVKLDPGRLNPARLVETGLFSRIFPAPVGLSGVIGREGSATSTATSGGSESAAKTGTEEK
jgi:purine-binding chemotaxis protein CheW